MKSNNTLQATQKPKFSAVIRSASYQKLIQSTLGNPSRAQRFISAITSAVAVNPALQECDPGTILSAALLGESLNLSPSPQLGQYYMLPFNDKKNNRKSAQFVLGYKGMIQLAVRSGCYRKIIVYPIKQGELIRFDPLEETIQVQLIEQEEQREATPNMGYYAMFEYTNGSFRKAMYWSQEKMELHADQYSPAFSLKTYLKIKNGEIPVGELWKYSSFWYKNFETMACKTMLRQLIGKWGVLSIDLQRAISSDERVIQEDGTPEPGEEIPAPQTSDPEPAESSEIPSLAASAAPPDNHQDYEELPPDIF